ncbi:N-acetylglucosamine-6-phosphate deacetylase [Arthrobacter sp. G.S.26]|uniref:N-acetylglucosamine-6-phosphate deacetylase n=1 Tax=Arthrobacter sp. G.S.26 TaxID=3433706 RepID=UPI003D784F20
MNTSGATATSGNGLVLRGRIVSADLDVADGIIAVAGGVITFAGPASGFPGESGPARPDRILLPGLVDLHCHGALGADFADGSAEGATAAARYLHSRGTTTLLASVVTGPPAQTLRNLEVLRQLAADGLIAGSHLEGPFLSSGQCGAHDPALLLEPDLDLLAAMMTAAGPTLESMTLAAELPGMAGVVELLTRHGVIPSLGHTAADNTVAAEFLKQAAAGLAEFAGLAGAAASMGGAGVLGSAGSAELFGLGDPAGSAPPSGRLRPTVTHLFNAMPSLHHRSPGPVSASLGAARAGEAVVELIADGVHLAPETVKLVFDLVGARNIALVTDSMAATGLQDGQYKLGPLAVTVQQGVARVDTTGAIAGGTSTLLDVVRSTVAAGIPLQDAVTAATVVPADVLGVSAHVGGLRPAMAADVLVVDPDLTLAGVLRRGKWVTQLQ